MEKRIIKDLYCFQCSLQFDKKTIYDMHLKIMHNYISRSESFLTEIKDEPKEIELATKPTNITIASKEIQTINERTFACTFCDKTYKKKNAVKNHEKIHTKTLEKPFACKYCNKTYRQKFFHYLFESL